jgi:hypothetical protein
VQSSIGDQTPFSLENKVVPMNPHRFGNRMRRGKGFGKFAAFALLITVVGCSGTPSPRLFLLSPGPIQSPGQRAMLSSAGGQPMFDVHPPSASGARAAVAVTVPQYLDRPEIMVRTDDFELEPLPDARWAEDLTMTASRTLAEDLNRLLPAYDIIAWPNRSGDPVGYRIDVNLSHFEMNKPNQVAIAGRWVITDDRAAKERASANFRNAAFVAASDPTSIVEAMSSLLGGVSSEIASELQKQQTVRRR